MNGIIYCRVSSKEQVEGTSLQSQELACKEYARANNIEILKAFIEEGESAKFADRTRLLELIDFCRENRGRVQVLLVWKVDRFARNVQDHFNVKATLLKYGVRIASVTEPIDSNPEGKLMETILAGFAQFDNDIRRMRTIQGMRRKLQEGLFPWRPPHGYIPSTVKGEKKTRPDRPDQPLFGLLQRAWKTLVTGAYPKAQIRRLLETWGVRLSSQSIDNLFANQYYAGILVDPWSGAELPGLHPPMVTRAEFAQAQQILRRRARKIPHQKSREDLPLRGLIRCASCQHLMTAGISRGRSQRYAYYHCFNKTCQRYGKTLPASTIHEAFTSFLQEVSPTPKLIAKLEAVLCQVVEEQRAFTDARRQRHASTMARVERQLRELIRLKTEGLLTDAEFRTQKEMLADHRHALENKVPLRGISRSQVQEHFAEITEPLGRLDELWGALPQPSRRRFEHLLLPAGFLAERFRTADLGLLFRAFADLGPHESNVVPLVRKFWNQIWRDIQGLSEIVRDWGQAQRTSKEPVRKDPREYPQRDDLEPERPAA